MLQSNGLKEQFLGTNIDLKYQHNKKKKKKDLGYLRLI